MTSRYSTGTSGSNISNGPFKRVLGKASSIKSKTRNSEKSNKNYSKAGSGIKKNFKKKGPQLNRFGKKRQIKAREEYFDSVKTNRSKSKNLTRDSMGRMSSNSSRKRPSKNLSIGQFRTNLSSRSRGNRLAPKQNLIKSPYFQHNPILTNKIRRKGKGSGKILSRDLSSGSKRRTHNIFRPTSLTKRQTSRTKREATPGPSWKPEPTIRPKIKKKANISKSPAPKSEIFLRRKQSPMMKVGRKAMLSPLSKLKQRSKKSMYSKGLVMGSTKKKVGGKGHKKKKRGNFVPLNQLYAHASRNQF